VVYHASAHLGMATFDEQTPGRNPCSARIQYRFSEAVQQRLDAEFGLAVDMRLVAVRGVIGLEQHIMRSEKENRLLQDVEIHIVVVVPRSMVVIPDLHLELEFQIKRVKSPVPLGEIRVQGEGDLIPGHGSVSSNGLALEIGGHVMLGKVVRVAIQSELEEPDAAPELERGDVIEERGNVGIHKRLLSHCWSG
jgi:hypothetical protein